MKDLSGKIAVVTGGGTGMGRELVRQLIAHGCDVATCDIFEESLKETLDIGKKAVSYTHLTLPTNREV